MSTEQLTLCLVGVVLEDIDDFLLPAHVFLFCEIFPLVAQRIPHEATVLRAEAELRNMAHPLI